MASLTRRRLLFPFGIAAIWFGATEARAATDSFTGSVLDVATWEPSAPLGGGAVRQDDALLLANDGTTGSFCYTPGLSGPGAGLLLRRKLTGDFDISVTFRDFHGAAASSSDLTQAYFNVYQDRDHQLHLKRLRGRGNDGVQTVAKVAGAVRNGAVSYSPGRAGTLRLVRTGGVITTFVDGVQSYAVWGLERDVLISLMLLGAAAAPSQVTFDDFTIHSGTLLAELEPCREAFAGTAVDRRTWYVSKPLGASTVTQDDGLVLTSDGTEGTFCHTPGLFGPGAGVALRRKLVGDFEVSVAFHDFVAALPHSALTQAYVTVYQDQDHQLSLKRLHGPNVDGVQSVAMVKGRIVNGPVTPYGHHSGSFRIARRAGELTTYLNDGTHFRVGDINGDVTVSMTLLGATGGTSRVVFDGFNLMGTLNEPTPACDNEPPVVIPGGPYLVEEGGVVRIEGGGSDPEGDPITFAWDVGGVGAFAAATKSLDFATGDRDGPGQETLTLQVCDAEGECVTAPVRVTIANVAPAARFSAPTSVTVDHTGVLTLTGATDASSADTSAGFRHSFACDGLETTLATSYQAASVAGSRVCTFTTIGAQVVKARIFDKDGGFRTYQTVVTVTPPPNRPPSANAGGRHAALEGNELAIRGAGSDPDGDALSFAWDLDGDGTFETAGQTSAWTPIDGPDSRLVHLRVCDAHGACVVDSAVVDVDNLAPSARFEAPALLIEGGSGDLAFSEPRDPGLWDAASGWRYSFACDGRDESLATHADDAGSAAGTRCTFAQNGSHVVKGRIFDKDGGHSTYAATVVVANAPPVVGAIIAPTTPQALGAAVNVSAAFSDAGRLDRHEAVWHWGDGSTSVGAIDEGVAIVSGTHQYAAAGMYTIELVVSDQDGGTGRSSFRYLVVYDAGVGHATAAGAIESAVGACPMCGAFGPAKARFAFSTRYDKGAIRPTGRVEFELQPRRLAFVGTGQDWLIVAGDRLKLGGTGTLDGQAGYRFIITAASGARSGRVSGDSFRIKIWNAATGAIAYDNRMGASDDATDGNPLSTGQISIHR